jgi:hypothetical protein
MRLFRPFLFAALATVALALPACRDDVEVTPIQTLLDDPSRFDRQVVRVAGTVTKALGVLGYGAYQVDDGTGGIAVITKSGGAPREGAEIGVEGEFRSAYTIGTSTGAAIVEHGRYTPEK